MKPTSVPIVLTKAKLKKLRKSLTIKNIEDLSADFNISRRQVYNILRGDSVDINGLLIKAVEYRDENLKAIETISNKI